MAEGRWTNTIEVQNVLFDRPCRGRCLEIAEQNEVHPWTCVSVAEIDIIVDPVAGPGLKS